MPEYKARSAMAIAAAALAVAPLAAGCDPTGETSAGPVTHTHTRTPDLFTGTGEPAAGITVTDEVSASCTPSLLSPENPAARRCFTNETSLVMDPCFVPDRPTATEPGTGPEWLAQIDTVALCMSEPKLIEVTKVYVLVDEGTPPRDQAHFDPHWYLELGDGTGCEKVFGVPEIRENLHLSYACDNGYLYGIPDEAKQIWTIHHRDEDSAELEVAEVRTAWT